MIDAKKVILGTFSVLMLATGYKAYKMSKAAKAEQEIIEIEAEPIEEVTESRK